MDKFIDIITSDKVYLPFVYILIGLILNKLLYKVVNKIEVGHNGNRGKDKRRDTIINLVRSIGKYLIVILSRLKDHLYHHFRSCRQWMVPLFVQ